MCFARMPCSAHQLRPSSSASAYALRATSVAFCNGPPVSAHAAGSFESLYPFGTLDASNLIGPLLLVIQLTGRWSDSVAPITSSRADMFGVCSSVFLVQESGAHFPPAPPHTAVHQLHCQKDPLVGERELPETGSEGRANSTLLSIQERCA